MQTKLDATVLDVLRHGDQKTLLLHEKDENLRKLIEKGYTILHLAARFGNEQLAMETLTAPQIAAQNQKLNTPLHLACRGGYTNIVRLLVDANPSVVDKLNARNESALHVACRKSELQIVKLLVKANPSVVDKLNAINESALHVACQAGKHEIVSLLITNYPRLLKLEEDTPTTSLHVATFHGHTGIVEELLTVRKDLALKQDAKGRTPLHVACSEGHLHIIKMILSASPQSADCKTIDGETILHLAIKNSRFEAVQFIVETLKDTKLVNTPDNNGNTVLHLAATDINETIIYLLDRSADVNAINCYGHIAFDRITWLLNTDVDVNAINRYGNTALDVFNPPSESIYLKIAHVLREAGAKKSNELQETSRENEIQSSDDPDQPPKTGWRSPGPTSSLEKLHHGYSTDSSSKTEDVQNAGLPKALNDSNSYRQREIEDFNPCFCFRHRRQKDIQNEGTEYPRRPRHRSKREVQNKSFHNVRNRLRHRREKEVLNEALRDARSTITIVAVLIATVTFASGISPPGGFHEFTGKTIMGRQTSFKVFMVCNIVALFLSLGIVIFLVSILPFRRKPMMRLLLVTRTVMWLSVVFMAAGYIAALWTTLPRGEGMTWVLVAVASIGGGGTLVMFGVLGVLSARQWARILKWRSRTKKEEEESRINRSLSEHMMVRKYRKHVENWISEFLGPSSIDSYVGSGGSDGYYIA